MPRRLLAIANPISGRGRAADLAPRLEELARRAEVQIELRLTQHRGHARDLAAAAQVEGFDAVISVGGDGTMNEVVNGLGPGGLPLVIVPRGTGNVLAKELRAPKDPLRCVQALRAWQVKQRDLGRLNGERLFACFVGAGFDGECTRALSERRGAIRMSNYLPIMWRAVRDSDYQGLSYELDGASSCGPFSYVLAAITPAYGGPIELVGGADPADGALDVFALKGRIRPLRLGWILARAFAGRLGSYGCASVQRGTAVVLAASEPDQREVPIQVDGDFAGYLPARCEILPGAMSYLSMQPK